MSPGEERMLRALDLACWENSEAGGDGWVPIHVVAAALAIGYCWASQLLTYLRSRGWVERRWAPSRSWTGNRRREYAPSEAASDLLLALDTNCEDH